jgi:hypothetical protein
MAPRQMKMPVKGDTDKESEEVFSQRKRPESGRYLLQVDRQTRAPTKRRKLLNRWGSKSRRVTQSFRCRFMTASITPTPSWSYRVLHRDEGWWRVLSLWRNEGSTVARTERPLRRPSPYVGQALTANSPETFCRFAAGGPLSEAGDLLVRNEATPHSAN